MTTINFPSSPTVDQEYTLGDKTWVWNGTGWVVKTKPTTTELTTLVANNQTGTAYTLALSDVGKRVSMSNAAANTLTVPLNSAVAFPVNTMLFVSQDGAGATSIAATGGVTINTAEGLKVGGQYKMITLIKTATDTWLAIGTIA